MSIQELPHDGVAALAVPAVSAPVPPTPPTRVSVAAAASTLLLMDMERSSLGTRSRTLRTTTPSWPRSTRRILARSLGTLPAPGDLAEVMNGCPDRSCFLERERPRDPPAVFRFKTSGASRWFTGRRR